MLDCICVTTDLALLGATEMPDLAVACLCQSLLDG